MPRWEKGSRFTTLVIRKENLLVTNGAIGKEGKSEIQRFHSVEAAEAEMATRVAKLDATGWTRVDFTIDPNAKPANRVLPPEDAARQLERVLREKGFHESPPRIADAAVVLAELGKLRFSSERTWIFDVDTDTDDGRVLVMLECRFQEHTAQLCLVFKADDVPRGHVERAGSVGAFLERARATKSWAALSTLEPVDFGVEGY